MSSAEQVDGDSVSQHLTDFPSAIGMRRRLLSITYEDAAALLRLMDTGYAALQAAGHIDLFEKARVNILRARIAEISVSLSPNSSPPEQTPDSTTRV